MAGAEGMLAVPRAAVGKPQPGAAMGYVSLVLARWPAGLRGGSV